MQTIKRMLVLDDENEVAATICMMASTAGYETEYTDNADEFLARINVLEPTHVMIDLQLADRDGIEVIHQLGKMGCSAMVIIVSGLGGRILESSARAATENGLRLMGTLSKPFSRNVLLALLASEETKSLSNQKSNINVSYFPVSKEQLTEALQAKEFVVHFQPKILCANNELVGFECLARWPQNGGVMIPPDVFISLAEHSGEIHELTKQVYDFALANAPTRGRETNLKIGLNLSPLNLSDEEFPRWLLEKCEHHDVAPSQIILELTETASMNNPLALLENLTQLRIRGFHLSIDDFGVGYSSLVQLARLPFSELKIDQMFIKSLASSKEYQSIVTALVGLGKSLDLTMVAEGVEDAWALNFLQDIGCDQAQGYFIARPMDKFAAAKWDRPSWENGL